MLTEQDWQTRFLVYRSFRTTAVAPTAAQLAAASDLSVSAVEASLTRLADAHFLALVPGTFEVWMAHPFSALETAYPVATAERTYYANCAWDALGIPAVLGVDAETATQCADCGEPVALHVRGGQLQPSGAVVHFVVPPRRFWEDVGFT